jgi:hypothetical protein
LWISVELSTITVETFHQKKVNCQYIYSYITVLLLTEILLKVVFNTITLTLTLILIFIYLCPDIKRKWSVLLNFRLTSIMTLFIITSNFKVKGYCIGLLIDDVTVLNKLCLHIILLVNPVTNCSCRP